MDLKQVKRVYFIGIGGIGMSALARYFLDNGKSVAGYDIVQSLLTDELAREGAVIHFEDDISIIPPEFIEQSESSLIVYTPAIPSDHQELNFFISSRYHIHKRSEVLGWISKDKFTIAVGGTHGKTSTSWMITHLLISCDVDCYALLGGVSVNYNTNYISPKNKECKLIVVEADEFDRSFLQLKPDVSIITSTDPDHLDIYGKADELTKTYQDFADRLNVNGMLITHESASISSPKQAASHIKYDLDSSEDLNAENIQIINGAYCYDLVFKKEMVGNVCLEVAGKHNILNSLAAFAAVKDIVTDKKKLVYAYSSFKGVKRRFEYIIRNEKQVFVDDYAHHPSELAATIETLKELYPNEEILGIFQPHLYSRTRDFMSGFAEVLSSLDTVVLLDIYPAREKPIPGISSDALLDKIINENKHLVTRQELPGFVKMINSRIVVTLGAGDIDRLIEPIKRALLD